MQLDTSRTYLDRGKSAYHGRHRAKGGALAAFLAEVESGQIPRGSCLIIENLDRLSRENPWDAVPLLCSLVNAGVSVATLSPSEMIYERGRDLTALVLAVVEFGRSHSESESKAQRMSEVWAEKRRAVREEGALMTRRTVAWIEEHDGKLMLVPERARLVRRMFELAIRGYGLSLIVRELTTAGVACWGRGGSWSKTYIHKIMAGRVVLGEYQPIKDGKPDGDPVADYYPAVVDEDTWLQAQAALARRKNKPGPVGKQVAALFSGLIRDARTQDRMFVAWQTRGVKGKTRCRRRVLVPAASMEGASRSVSFPNEVFEAAILSLLKEVNPADVLGKEPASESADLMGEIAVLQQRMRQIEEELTGDAGDVPALARVLKNLDTKLQDLQSRRAAAQQRESNPRSGAWLEAKTLLDVATDEANRLRLRDLLRQIVDEIWVLIVPRRSHRFAVVQLYFTGDGRRNFLIHYQGAGNGRAGGWDAKAMPEAIAFDDLDLRRPKDAAELAADLEAIDLSAIQ